VTFKQDNYSSDVVPGVLTAMPDVLIDFEPATPEEVRSVTRKAPDKSYELDPIPTWLLKHCLDDLTSLETGSVPMCFKGARIRTPLKKCILNPDI